MIGFRLPKRCGLGGLLDRLLSAPQLFLGPREALVILADFLLLVLDLDLPPFEAHLPPGPGRRLPCPAPTVPAPPLRFLGPTSPDVSQSSRRRTPPCLVRSGAAPLRFPWPGRPGHSPAGAAPPHNGPSGPGTPGDRNRRPPGPPGARRGPRSRPSRGPRGRGFERTIPGVWPPPERSPGLLSLPLPGPEPRGPRAPPRAGPSAPPARSIPRSLPRRRPPPLRRWPRARRPIA